KQQADRYSLAKQIKSVEWATATSEPNMVVVKIFPNGGPVVRLGVDKSKGMIVSADQAFMNKPLDEVVGKELTKKILGGEPSKNVSTWTVMQNESFSGFVVYDDQLNPQSQTFETPDDARDWLDDIRTGR